MFFVTGVGVFKVVQSHYKNTVSACMFGVIFLFFLTTGCRVQAQSTGGYALQFDGSNDRVTLQESTSFQPTGGSFTAEAWVYIDDDAPGDQKVLMTLGGWSRGYAMNIYTHDGHYFFSAGVYLNGHQYNAEDADLAIPAKTWTHLAMTWSQDSGVTSYQNGTQTAQINTQLYSYSASGNITTIGEGYTNMWFAPFKGKIDEVRIWNTVRTQEQISDNMYTEIAQNANLKAYFKMTNGSGTSLSDDSGTNTASAISGATWVESTALSVPTYVITNPPTNTTVTLASSTTDVTSTGQSGTQSIKVSKTTATIAVFNVAFSANRNWTNLIADTDGTKAVLHYPGGFTSLPGSSGNSFTLYVPDKGGNRVRICPNAANLAAVTSGCAGEYFLTSSSASVTKTSLNGTLYWVISGLTGTGGEDGGVAGTTYSAPLFTDFGLYLTLVLSSFGGYKITRRKND